MLFVAMSASCAMSSSRPNTSFERRYMTTAKRKPEKIS